jgi:hypothetical protein
MDAWIGWLIAFVILLIAFIVQAGTTIGIASANPWLFDQVSSVLGKGLGAGLTVGHANSKGLGAGLTVGMAIAFLPVLYCGVAAWRQRSVQAQGMAPIKISAPVMGL